MKRPSKYALPLKSRKDIEAFLSEEGGRWTSRSWQGDGNFLFCFNVKLRSLDLSFDALVKTMQGFEVTAAIDSKKFTFETKTNRYFNTDFLAAARQRYVEKFGSEDMGETGGGGEWYSEVEYQARQSFQDQDYFLFSGKQVEVEFGFMGRSSGWLVLQRFEGIPMDGPEAVIGMEYRSLVRLYELVVMLGADYHNGRGAKEAVQLEAAQQFFHLVCSDLEKAA